MFKSNEKEHHINMHCWWYLVLVCNQPNTVNQWFDWYSFSKIFIATKLKFKGTPWIILKESGQPHSAQESTKIRRLHQRGRETKKSLFLCSSRLCLMGWSSFSLEILKVSSCAFPGSSQLGTPVAKRCCIGFLEIYRKKCFVCKYIFNCLTGSEVMVMSI